MYETHARALTQEWALSVHLAKMSTLLLTPGQRALARETTVHIVTVLSPMIQGSPQAGVKAERVGVVWAEFVTTSIDSFPTSKLN